STRTTTLMLSRRMQMSGSDEERNGRGFEGFAILELMGHRRIAGYVSQVEQFGTAMLRIDIPGRERQTTQFYSGSSIYCLTPTTEDIATAIALKCQPEPVHQYELPAPRTSRGDAGMDDDDDD